MNAALYCLTLGMPSLSMCVLTMASLCLPLSFQGVYPDMMWLFLFVFGVYAPPLIPLSVLFILSLVIDILGDTIVGTHPIIMLILWGIVQTQRRFLYVRSFLSLWGIFSLMTVFSTGLSVAVMTMISPDAPLSFFQWTRILTGFLTTILTFPVVFHWMMTILRRLA